jgi:uroporphyrin-III C-methyltransferase/precorrin-2 dehydrogenase/sirohydrochlorin ferrochelatase
LFPLFLRLERRRAVVVGAGEDAAAKLRLLRPCGADLLVVASDPCDEVREMADAGQITLARREFAEADLAGAALCIIALADEAAALLAAEAARKAGVPVNAVDRPGLSDFFVPAIVQRQPVTIAIGSAGLAPALARDLKARIAAAVPAGYGALARLSGRWRGRVAAALPERSARRRFWDAVLGGEETQAALNGNIKHAEELLAARLMVARQRGVKREVTPRGRVSLVGAGPGDPGLLTMRALLALQTADVILHDALVGPAVLDVARREARRIDVGKRCGHHALNQETINRLMLKHASQGAHVVRLKGGDPLIFGRAGEELEFLERAGLKVEVIPGVTAACAAAARLGIPLTYRGIARSLHFVAGHGADDLVPEHDWTALAGSGGTLAIYMSGHTLAGLARRLIAAGLPPDTPGLVVENASRPDERHVRGCVSELAGRLAAAQFCGPTLVLIGEAIAAARALPDGQRVAA